MEDLLLVALAGFAASLVDGALGMGFGPTSSTILLSTGLSPAAASTTVNIAKVATGFAAGVSHWRFGNIDRTLVLRLALPGCGGALIGVTVLANVDGQSLRPILAALLLLVGLRMLFRFRKALPLQPDHTTADPHSKADVAEQAGRGAMAAGAAGGISNGLIGAWGPIVTPYLLHRGLVPRYAIGSVNTAEVFVAAASATGLVAAMGKGGVDPKVVGAMLVGGVVASPIAAWTIKWMPPRAMGLAVAALLSLTNFRELTTRYDLGVASLLGYVTLLVLVILASVAPRLHASVSSRRSSDRVPASIGTHTDSIEPT